MQILSGLSQAGAGQAKLPPKFGNPPVQATLTRINRINSLRTAVRTYIMLKVNRATLKFPDASSAQRAERHLSSHPSWGGVHPSSWHRRASRARHRIFPDAFPAQRVSHAKALTRLYPCIQFPFRLSQPPLLLPWPKSASASS